MPTTELRHEIEQLLFRERQLLEARQFDRWLELMTDDVSYRVPNGSGDASSGAIAQGNYRTLEAQARLLAHPNNPTQVPQPRVKYFVSNVIVGAESDGEVPVQFSLLVYLLPGHGALVQHPASCEYRVRRGISGWKICSREIRLLESDRPLGQLPML